MVWCSALQSLWTARWLFEGYSSTLWPWIESVACLVAGVFDGAADPGEDQLGELEASADDVGMVRLEVAGKGISPGWGSCSTATNGCVWGVRDHSQHALLTSIA